MENRVNLAGCIIKNPRGKILLLHRNNKGRIQWEIPGGKIDEKEPAESAAVREVMEELGIEVEIGSKLGSKDFTEGDYIMGYTWFSAEIKKGEPKVLESGFDKLGYFSLEEMEKNEKRALLQCKKLSRLRKLIKRH